MRETQFSRAAGRGGGQSEPGSRPGRPPACSRHHGLRRQLCPQRVPVRLDPGASGAICQSPRPPPCARPWHHRRGLCKGGRVAAPPCPALVTPAPFSARAPQARLRCAPLSFFQVSQNAFSGLGVCRSEDLAARGPRPVVTRQQCTSRGPGGVRCGTGAARCLRSGRRSPGILQTSCRQSLKEESQEGSAGEGVFRAS